MNKICTTIEQSQKLIKLGIDVSTADMMWDDWSLIDEGWKLNIGYYPEIEKDYGRKCFPAWSLTALLDILNKIAYSIDEDASVNLSSYKAIKWDLGIDNTDLGLITETNLIDVCVEMIYKLKEKNLI